MIRPACLSKDLCFMREILVCEVSSTHGRQLSAAVSRARGHCSCSVKAQGSINISKILQSGSWDTMDYSTLERVYKVTSCLSK